MSLKTVSSLLYFPIALRKRKKKISIKPLGKMRHTRNALDYVQIQRIYLSLNVDAYPVFPFFKKLTN